MNALAPDVVTIGNHEVDYGIAHLLFIENARAFPSSTQTSTSKNTSTRLFTPYKILRMDGMNILFIGIITQDVINQTKSESLVAPLWTPPQQPPRWARSATPTTASILILPCC